MINENRQVQKELFEDFADREKARQPKGIFHKKPKFAITVYPEHIVFTAIGFIILSAVIFSMGVEKGKTLSLALQLAPEKLVVKETIDNVLQESSTQHEESPVIEDTTLPQVKDSELLSGFTVQVASHTKKDTAQSHARQLQAKGYDAFTLHRGNHHIICIGKFNDRQAAESEMKNLRKKYHDCLVRKI
jgi:hypothetical protein